MKLYLIRHGDYASSDITQALNQKGEADIERMASYLKNHDVILDKIWHSAKLRAVESAEIISKVFNCLDMQEKEYLSPNAPVKEIIGDLIGVENNVAIVSHLPFIPKLLSQLVFEEMSASFSFPTSSVAVAERVGGKWEFCEVITPELVNEQ